VEIEKSLIGEEVDRIVKKNDNNTNEVVYEIILHTEDEDLVVDKITTVEVMKDYNANIGSYIYVDFLLPMGDLVKHVYPYRNNVEISLIEVVNGRKDLNRYKILFLNLNEDYGSGRYKNQTKEQLNEQEYVTVRGQCVDRAVEAIRLKRISGIYRNVKPGDLVKGLFVNETKDIMVNGAPIKISVTLKNEDNTREYEHIIIPNGTKLIDLPTYLQETDYGLFNGHVGLFMERYRKGTYFNRCDLDGSPCKNVMSVSVFPLYKPDISANAKHKLIIYGVPNIKYSQVENTYLIENEDIHIISNDDSKKINKGDTDFTDKGVGYVVLDVNKVMHRPVDVLEPEVINTKNSVNIENYLKDKRDGSMYRTVKEPTDNLYHMRSDYMKLNGDMLQLKWNFSNPKYLLPGMSVIYVYLGDDNNVIRVNGVLQSHYTLCNVSSKMRSTILNVFIEKDKDELI